MVPTVTSPARVYAFSRTVKNRYRVMGWIFVALGFAAATFLASMVLTNSSSQDVRFMLAVVLGISAVPIIEGAIFLRGASRVSVAITGESVQANGLLSSKRMRIADIAGRRNVFSRGGTITYLVPRPNCNEGRLRLPDDIGFDDAFDLWLASLPNLNELSEGTAEPAGEVRSWQEQ